MAVGWPALSVFSQPFVATGELIQIWKISIKLLLKHLFCSLAILDPRVLSAFILVLCRSAWFCFLYRSNFLRLCVLRVTQQSEKHLQKITSVDEFLRRIYTVIHSNDPVARALTLRYSCLPTYYYCYYCLTAVMQDILY